MKARAASRFGFDPDASTLTLNQLLHHGEPDAGPLDAIAGGQGLKHPEDPVVVLTVDAWAMIADREDMIRPSVSTKATAEALPVSRRTSAVSEAKKETPPTSSISDADPKAARIFFSRFT